MRFPQTVIFVCSKAVALSGSCLTEVMDCSQSSLKGREPSFTLPSNNYSVLVSTCTILPSGCHLVTRTARPLYIFPLSPFCSKTCLYGAFLVQGPLKTFLHSKQLPPTATHTLIRLMNILDQISPMITPIIPIIRLDYG